MKRLRHPVRAIREPFGTAGLIVACVALVLALTGAAFAAAGLTGKQKKEVEKIAKKFAGKPGAPGSPGATGAQGPAGAKGDTGPKGDTGAAGANGKDGAPGAPGTAGTNGKSPEILDEAPAGCPAGGVTYGIEGVSNTEGTVCNGKQGDPGPPGSPWTAGGKLPPGQMETGAWSFSYGAGEASNGIRVPLSFFIPLASPLEGHVHFQYSDPEGFANACKGSTELPNPEPGELCVYVNINDEFNGTEFVTIESASFPETGASPEGALLRFTAPTQAVSLGGTYAVRAPLP